MMRGLRFAILLIGAVGACSAQTRVAVINSQKAIVETSEIKKAQADLETKFRPRQEQLARLQREIESLQMQLQGGKLNPSGEQQITAQGQRKQRELQRVQEDLQADVDRERNEILQRTGRRMQEIVTKLATDKGLDVVVDTANTVYFKPALDLTAEAVAAYDKAYPLK